MLPQQQLNKSTLMETFAMPCHVIHYKTRFYNDMNMYFTLVSVYLYLHTHTHTHTHQPIRCLLTLFSLQLAANI
ncbi:hypothetical protein XELAEV_18029128mg [Xenopus laevis]|uniref:Uncharacterized protein n=1 Tax=Xenopus laevis TaxID=8355 RepID=A0A974CST3_XENLA|nr:hypothetical protein XELAEV_18029128mg [Xenopus laevis]